MPWYRATTGTHGRGHRRERDGAQPRRSGLTRQRPARAREGRRRAFTENGKTYDLILDAAAHRSMFDYARALNPGGTFVMVGGSVGRILQLLVTGSWISRSGQKKMRLLQAKANHDLAALCELFQAGKLSPVIDRCFPLNEVPDAFRYFGEGRVRGKIV
ncbi:zinc-binding dehydrogenase [Sorangium sp. So ce291]|uniref:zinc-binding dehydrogenase n=1 Tax=Sorangium sp. So ce291 TaxID=3133294 RepID=UPI003F6444EE